MVEQDRALRKLPRDVQYYHLPFCVPEKIEDQPGHKVPHLGEVIEGNKYKNSGLHIEFARDTSKTVVCSQILSDHDVDVSTTR